MFRELSFPSSFSAGVLPGAACRVCLRRLLVRSVADALESAAADDDDDNDDDDNDDDDLIECPLTRGASESKAISTTPVSVRRNTNMLSCDTPIHTASIKPIAAVALAWWWQ